MKDILRSLVYTGKWSQFCGAPKKEVNRKMPERSVLVLCTEMTAARCIFMQVVLCAKTCASMSSVTCHRRLCDDLQKSAENASELGHSFIGSLRPQATCPISWLQRQAGGWSIQEKGGGGARLYNLAPTSAQLKVTYTIAILYSSLRGIYH